MEIKDFYYERIFFKQMIFDKKLKCMMNKLKKIQYSSEDHKRLLSYDIYAYPEFKIKGTNFFEETKELEYLSMQKTKYIMGNLIEKYIVFSEKSLSCRNLSINDERIFHNIIINSGSLNEDDNFLSRLMFSMSSEQMIFQDRNLEQYFFRMITIFSNCLETRNLIRNKIGLELEEIFLLYKAIASYVISFKKVVCNFKISGFKEYILKGDLKHKISEDKIDNFLKFILIDLNDFINKYQDYRKNKNIFMSYEKLNQIDKYLPKVSFHNPFIKINDNNILLVSYTALNQFMHMENLFYLIAEEKNNNYKSEVFGYLLEKYIGLMAYEFSIYHGIDLKIHYSDKKNQVYKVGKYKYDFPDVIIESDKFIIFIESKVSAFNLKNTLINFCEDSFSNTIEAIEKSQKNIDRFLKHNPLKLENLDEKKIYKLVCFNVINSTMLSILKYTDFINLDSIYLTDLQSLEALFNITNEKLLNVILDNFEIEYKNNSGNNSIYHFCIEKYKINYEKFQQVQEKTLKEFFN